MPGKAGTLELLAQHLGLALEPLQGRLTADGVIPFFAELGLQFPPQLLQPKLTAALAAASAGAAGLLPALNQLAADIAADNEAKIVQGGLALIKDIRALIASLPQIGVELTTVSATLPGMNAAEVAAFAQKLPTKILDHALISHLEGVQPGAVAIGNLLGIINVAPSAGAPGDPIHPPFVRRDLALSRIGDVLKSPAALWQTLFQWGSPGFDGAALLPKLSSSFDLLGFYSELGTSGPPNVLLSDLLTVQVNPASNPPGLTATLRDDLPAGFDLTLPLTPRWSARMKVKGTFATGLTAAFIPPFNLRLRPPKGTLDGLLELDLIAKAPDTAHPMVLVGQTGGSRLQADAVTVGAGLKARWDAGSGSAVAEPSLAVEVSGGKVVIDTSSADGFLATVLAGIHVEAGFDFALTWTPDTGIHIDGGAQLGLTLPLHLSLGPVTIPTLYLIAGASASGLPLELSVALGLTLGPIAATVDRLGLTGLLSFPGSGGNLGPANLALGFKPPNGLGLEVDAGVVAGGGYISFDPEKGRYAGVLDLSIAEVIQIKVIGVLDTIMPDGSSGFSFLFIITFELPPIQLGFGFTLNGVGGLGGVNRTMSIDALHTGFRAHTLDSIMFPPDPVANAPQIISNLRSFFPPAQGRYLFGPMLEVGWGTPTLITLEIGVIVEVPDPIRLAILGLIHAGLPTRDVPLIELHIDILGTLDLGTKTFQLEGSLYDSHVLIFALSGDLFFRLCWGDDPAFIYSLGGFHPHFNTTGLDLPPMRRLCVSIGDGDNPRISSNSYFAITSNSLQFGANVEAYASAAGFAIHGYLGFDVLVIFSPFSFEFDFSAGFDVSFEGVSLLGLNVDGLFSGPRPWHLHGEASIHFLCFTASASLDLSWGDATPVTLPAKAVLPDLLPALAAPGNWSSALPDGSSQAVTLRPIKPGDKALLVHPLGVVSVGEKLVPLDLPITRYGNATPSDGDQFSISKVQLNGVDGTKQNVKDYFAGGQFLTLSDADKLSRPSFERYDCGVKIGSSSIRSGADSPRTVVYEDRYIDVPGGLARLAGRHAMKAEVQSSLVRQGAGHASALKNSGLAAYKSGPASTAVTTADPSYGIAAVSDLSVRSDIAAGAGTTYFQVRAALDAHLALHPEDAGELQIMPMHELRKEAA